MKNTCVWTVCAVLFFLTTSAFSLGPHECIIIANQRSMESVELANYYAYLRQIPPVNIIHVNLPDKMTGAGATMTPDEFRELIYNPVQKVLRERNLASHILVWLYSLDFPVEISTTPSMSLTGMTFVRGHEPESEQIKSGNWLSPLFIGPDRADGPMSPSTSFEDFTLRLTTNMPIPSMMLGWSGSRGMAVDQIREQLRKSASSDAAQPPASIYFEISDDVRSKTRAWQFDPVARELAKLNVTAITISNKPAERSDLMGIICGRPTFNVSDYGAFGAGAYADNLTSLGAIFHDPEQTKLTEWLKKGVAGASGTVTEPYAVWSKFPHARMFAHYAGGCTLIESIYLSTRCPLQLLSVGDALCSPWTKPPGITLVSMADDETAPVVGKCEFLASSWGGFGQPPPITIFFLDGRPVTQAGSKPEFDLDSNRLYDGYHDLRVVAYAHDTIRHQGFDFKSFTTRNRNRGVTLTGYEPRQKVDLYHDITFQISAEGSPRDAAIVAQERVIAKALYTNNITFRIPPSQVGAGPVSFQAVVVYPDNEPVRSAPILLNIEALNQPPVISSIGITTNADRDFILGMSSSDPEKDPVTGLWSVNILRNVPHPLLEPESHTGKMESLPGAMDLSARSDFFCATYDVDKPNRIKEIRTQFRFTAGDAIGTGHQAGVIFNYLDADNYFFWGVNGRLSAWSLVRVRDGKEEMIMTKGAPIETLKDYNLAAISMDGGKMGFFVNHDLLILADVSFSAGRVGLRNGQQPARYEHLLISPPSTYRSFFTEQQDSLVVGKDHRDELTFIFGGARDIQFTTIKPAEPASRSETK